MSEQPIHCLLHDRALSELKASLTEIKTAQLRTMENQATMAEGLVGLRREMGLGFEGVYKRQDATNGRVTTLEAARGKMEVDIAAQESFTPGLFRTIEALSAENKRDHESLRSEAKAEREAIRQNVSDRSEKIWNRLDELSKEDSNIAGQIKHDEGFAGGAAKMGIVVWVLLAALIGWALFIWAEIRQHEAATSAVQYQQKNP